MRQSQNDLGAIAHCLLVQVSHSSQIFFTGRRAALCTKVQHWVLLHESLLYWSSKIVAILFRFLSDASVRFFDRVSWDRIWITKTHHCRHGQERCLEMAGDQLICAERVAQIWFKKILVQPTLNAGARYLKCSLKQNRLPQKVQRPYLTWARACLSRAAEYEELQNIMSIRVKAPSRTFVC